MIVSQSSPIYHSNPFPPDCQVALEAHRSRANLNKRLGSYNQPEDDKYSENSIFWGMQIGVVSPLYHISICIYFDHTNPIFFVSNYNICRLENIFASMLNCFYIYIQVLNFFPGTNLSNEIQFECPLVSVNFIFIHSNLHCT